MQSVRWPDHSTYEGLVKDDKCHVRWACRLQARHAAVILSAGRDGCGSPCFLSVAAWLMAHGHCAARVTAAHRGVFKYSNGDRYEGEFQDNQMSGFGVYVWGQEGSVYRGQVRAGAGVGEGSRAA